jgi:hypothetical protein
MPREKKTAAELAELIEQKLNEAGFNVAKVTVYPIKQLGWTASASSAPAAANSVATAVDNICQELRGPYDLEV